jgi:hypothetical protein
MDDRLMRKMLPAYTGARPNVMRQLTDKELADVVAGKYSETKLNVEEPDHFVRTKMREMAIQETFRRALSKPGHAHALY